MKNRDRILAALRSTDRLCDDCLSEVTGITPRQAVNADCRRMSAGKTIARSTEDCARCRRVKIVNQLASAPVAAARGPVPVPSTAPSEPTRWSGTTCYLLSCVRKKRSTATAAKDLYISDWFRKARAYVEHRGGPWFILSAAHGLLSPDTVIGPYEKTLNDMSAQQRREWARRVTEQMERLLPRCDEVEVLAGARYREFLMQYLSSRNAAVRTPLEGLRIGEQLHWLASHA